MLLLLTTNMAPVTSRANQQLAPLIALINDSWCLKKINFLVFETYALIRVTVHGKKTKIKRNQYKTPLYA